MKDKRLDIFFEHCSFRVCKHFFIHQDSKQCDKIPADKPTAKVNCGGDIAKCELEDE